MCHGPRRFVIAVVACCREFGSAGIGCRVVVVEVILVTTVVSVVVMVSSLVEETRF